MTSQTATESVWSVSKLSTTSVGSRRELVANSVHTADAKQLDSCVESAVCIGYWKRSKVKEYKSFCPLVNDRWGQIQSSSMLHDTKQLFNKKNMIDRRSNTKVNSVPFSFPGLTVLMCRLLFFFCILLFNCLFSVSCIVVFGHLLSY